MGPDMPDLGGALVAAIRFAVVTFVVGVLSGAALVYCSTLVPDVTEQGAKEVPR